MTQVSKSTRLTTKEKTVAEHKPKLGTGARFEELKAKLSRQGVRDPGALAASIGRKKFGTKHFAKLSAHGKKG